MNGVKPDRAQDQTPDDRQPRHQMPQTVAIDEDAESWGTLMMGLAAAKDQPDLRREFEENLAPEVLRAADECSSYEDFKRRLAQYRREGLTHA